ncbi:MAG: DUF308 domain-containing protein [Butyrivibrio sp.]|nr:DUF308 domain-containing protein [Butyrivibrio sp.]
MIFESLDRMKRSAIMTTIVLMVAGNVLMVLPNSILPLLNHLIGFLLLVYAALSVFHFMSSKKALIHYINLTIGLFGGLVGIVFLSLEEAFMNIMIALVCILPILLGLFGIYHAFAFARRSGRRGWWILVVLSSALVAFGGFIFYNPWVGSTVGTIRLIGGTLMYTAMVSALSLIWLWPIQKERG